MKILTATQIRQIDAYNIESQTITSADLMERASRAFTDRFMKQWDKSVEVKIFAGPGNNGGDALCVARQLVRAGYNVSTYFFNIGSSVSEDCMLNRGRLRDMPEAVFEEVKSEFIPPALEADMVVIDGLFGTGLSRPLQGGFASMVKYINASAATVVSIDMPSGFMGEDNSTNFMNHIIRADYTFTFQYPKLSFFFPENEQYVGEWEVLDIGLTDPDNTYTQTDYYYNEPSELAPMLKHRSRFAHKGSVGTASLIAGKRGMAGAAILSARASLRSGVGKVIVHTPECNVLPILAAVPEAVLDVEYGTDYFSKTFDANHFDALAIGPGVGTEADSAQAFIEQIRFTKSPIVIDADGLNILGSHRGWIMQLPPNTILTPHKGELRKLISTTKNSYEELQLTRELAVRQHLYVIIKGAFSAICTPEGRVFYNDSGNPGMATAGSGDVLTGVILALLGQGYSQEEACRLGVYLHGLAGDIAAERLCHEGVMASDIVECLPLAFAKLKNL